MPVRSLHWTSPMWGRVIYICVMDSISIHEAIQISAQIYYFWVDRLWFFNCNNWHDHEPLLFCHTLEIMLIFSVFEHIYLTTAMKVFTNKISVLIFQNVSQSAKGRDLRSNLAQESSPNTLQIISVSISVSVSLCLSVCVSVCLSMSLSVSLSYTFMQHFLFYNIVVLVLKNFIERYNIFWSLSPLTLPESISQSSPICSNP